MIRQPVTRRHFLATGLASLVLPSLTSCGFESTEVTEPFDGDPRLTARPGTPTSSIEAGTVTDLGIAVGRDAILWVPAGYLPETPMPLFVALHGAGGTASNWAGLQPPCGDRGMALLAVDSRGSTWDRARGPFGPDVFYLNEALAWVFDRCNVDPTRLTLGGFSDGASYALSLGVSNGDLFSHLVAFSPGFFLPAEPIVGRPRVFVSHGRSDLVLNIRASRDNIVPMLQGDGYDVTFEEFEGGHEVPFSIAADALDWIVA